MFGVHSTKPRPLERNSGYPNLWRLSLSSTSSDADNGNSELIETQDQLDDDNGTMAVKSPLKFIGPYPCMPLRFPDLATPSQKSRNLTGISLDFVLDTAANTNTINAAVAKGLSLEVVGIAPGGVGAGGTIAGGATYLLGECQLDIPATNDTEPFTFMEGLTASALPVASPAAAGLLGCFFFNCFPGGVEFDWRGDEATNEPPSVTYYGDTVDIATVGLKRAAIRQLPVSMLPSVTLRVNGVEMAALLDTGSPVTVMNDAAAELAGVGVVDYVEQVPEDSWNPFAKLASSFQAAKENAKATASGDVLTIAGTGGERINLLKSRERVALAMGDVEEGPVLGESHIYVGDLPGLAALSGAENGDGASPAAILGMDVLKLKPRMLYRIDEVYL